MTLNQPSKQHVCVVCGQLSLSELEAYRQLPRVTSDCKPWPAGGQLFVCDACGTVQKVDDAKWRQEISRIYGAYEIYALSSGAEQVIFSGDGQPTPRSRTLVEFVTSRISMREPGHLLDIGCGNGSALTNFSQALPGWRLDGSELSEKALPILLKIPGFDTLHTGPINRKYQLVTLIHSLEHMPSPSASLIEAARMLKPGGILFVEVPDVETSPFDILVADHRTHFSRATLEHLTRTTGLSLQFLSNDIIAKEITMLAVNGGDTVQTSIVAPDGNVLVRRSLNWLKSVIDTASDHAAREPIGIFGTSISAMWLYGALADRVEFFVDEDTSRVGRHIDGRPVLRPEDVPSLRSVYIPLAPAVAENVSRRLQGGQASYILPPAFPAADAG